MPIYEYYCHQCRKEFVLRRLMSQASEPASCPTCAAQGEKLLSAYSSKVDRYFRPAKPAFRQHGAPRDSQG